MYSAVVRCQKGHHLSMCYGADHSAGFRFVMLTANVEDVKRLARRLTSEPIVQKIIDFFSTFYKNGVDDKNDKTNYDVDQVYDDSKPEADRSLGSGFATRKAGAAVTLGTKEPDLFWPNHNEEMDSDREKPIPKKQRKQRQQNPEKDYIRQTDDETSKPMKMRYKNQKVRLNKKKFRSRDTDSDEGSHENQKVEYEEEKHKYIQSDEKRRAPPIADKPLEHAGSSYYVTARANAIKQRIRQVKEGMPEPSKTTEPELMNYDMPQVKENDEKTIEELLSSINTPFRFDGFNSVPGFTLSTALKKNDFDQYDNLKSHTEQAEPELMMEKTDASIPKASRRNWWEPEDLNGMQMAPLEATK